MVKNPCEARTLPAPEQVGHEEGWVPALAPLPEQVSHVTPVGTRIWAVLPAKASGSEISMLYRKSAPRSRSARRLRPRRPPMNSPNRSSKMSDMEEAKSEPKLAPTRPLPSNTALLVPIPVLSDPPFSVRWCSRASKISFHPDKSLAQRNV